MRIHEEAVSFSAFSLTRTLVAELLRRGIMDREELILAIRKEIDEQRTIAEPKNQGYGRRPAIRPLPFRSSGSKLFDGDTERVRAPSPIAPGSYLSSVSRT